MLARWNRGNNATDRYKEILAGLVKPGMRVLHAGCGWDKNEVSRPFKDSCEVIGVDLDPRVQLMFHSEFHLGSICDMPFEDNSIDLVFSEYVLEHVDDPQSAVQEMTRVLKPGGQILILTPNLWCYKSLVARFTPQKIHHLMGRIRYGEGHEEDMYATVFRYNTITRIKRLTKSSGLHIVAVHFVNNGPTWFVKFPILFEIFHLYHLAIDRWDLARQLRCALIVRLQKMEAPS